jgi:hypothetical protein
MLAKTLPDITPDGATVPLTADANAMATWVTVTAPKTNTGDIRVGDSHTGAARGATISPGGSFTFPRGAFTQGMYQLKTIYVYGASGSDAAATTYGV